MTPYLVTPPVSAPVTLIEMKGDLRVDHGDDDVTISQMVDGILAVLDGWGGLLGRCIMPQTWAIDVTGPGPHLLPFPDGSGVTATRGVDSLAVEVSRTGLGQFVTVADALNDDDLVISAEYALPAQRLPAAQALIKVMVKRDYDMLSGPAYDAAVRSIDALVNSLRWARV